MMTAAENETLVRVGPGTPMGEFMRQFWVPACLSSELEIDGEPMRLMLLCEKLIAFRDSEGRVGILDHLCPHRCASLFFGRNEESGIRCVYHGWKFDVDGNCLDQPNLPDKNRYPSGTKAKAYKTIERGGLVFVYMGTRETPPGLPELEPIMAEPDDRNIALTQRDCNYMQALEGDIDTSHLGFLHVGGIDTSRLDPADPVTYTVVNKAPAIGASEMPFGTMYAASRDAMAGFDHHRFASFIFPFWVTYPSNDMEKNMSANAWVPIDDEHTMIFNMDAQRAAPNGHKPMTYTDGTPVQGLARPVNYLPRTSDWMGRWRAAPNQANDYFMDHEARRSGASFSGITGIPLQDQMVQESMGPIVDRTKEHLSMSDRMVVLTRRVMLKAVEAYRTTGALPEVLDNPALCRLAAGGDMVTETGTDWFDAYERTMRALGKIGQKAAE
jgi:phenylpropionate dioxygenase-like ring-hydroxylating dioxygenase large terminal subunit